MKRFMKVIAVMMLMATVVCAVGCKKLNDAISGSNAPKGCIDGKFTVNEFGKQVYFSKGNLQYQPSTKTWRFAEKQYDMCVTADDYGTHYYYRLGFEPWIEITEEEYLTFVANNSGEISLYDGEVTKRVFANVKSHYTPSYSGWIDMFAWGTSGFDHGATCYQPWCYEDVDDKSYWAYGQRTCNLYDNVGYADWGYNAISNGGNRMNYWRTLTKEEWEYVINTRNTLMGFRYAKAQLNGISGLILFPDDWDNSVYTPNHANLAKASFDSNIISVSNWTTLEKHGAVFLPAVGSRRITLYVWSSLGISDIGEYGEYWSSSYSQGGQIDGAGVIVFNGHGDDYSHDGFQVGTTSNHVRIGLSERCNGNGHPVRLVCPVEN